MAQTWRNRTNGDPVHISLAAGTLTLSLAGRTNLSFDGTGRLVGAWLDGITYRRALDNRVLAKWQEPGPRALRRRQVLEDPARRQVLEQAYATARGLQADLAHRRLDVGASPAAFVEDAARWLGEIALWDWPRLEAEAQRFAQVYKPVPILPPDQYLALVLQATEGCSYNRCTFCTFYRNRPFRIKRESEFIQHVDAVKRFFGAGVNVRRKLFLADANAVVIAQSQLLPLLDAANRLLPVTPQTAAPDVLAAWRRDHPWALEGIYAFISAPDALHKRAEDFAEMGARNLHRLYVGLETGHDPLRRFLQKQGSTADVLEAVRTIKAGGLEVGIIAMVGMGGRQFQAAHRTGTVAAIQAMPLGPGDLVYLSPFVAGQETPYVADAEAAGLTPLTEDELAAEEQIMRRLLLDWARPRGVRISHYDIREFIY